MATKRFVIKTIRREWIKYYQRPKFGMPKEQFDQVVAHNWAMEKILDLLEKADVFDMDSCFIIVEDFKDEMDRCACKSKMKGTWFSSARDAAEWVLDILIYIKTQNEKEKIWR